MLPLTSSLFMQTINIFKIYQGGGDILIKFTNLSPMIGIFHGSQVPKDQVKVFLLQIKLFLPSRSLLLFYLLGNASFYLA